MVLHNLITTLFLLSAPALYQRGPGVELHSDNPEDPLAAERARVVIYLDGPAAPSSSVTAVMEQKDRRFIPELLAIPVGSSVSFPNLDPIFHNVFSLSYPESFDLGNYAQNQTRVVAFLKPGIEFVNCRLHPNMSAAIVIAPNKWCTIANPEGQFTLPDVPAGSYTIVAWHKAAGAIRKEINVAPGRGAAVEFFVPIDEAAANPVEAMR